jgi:hypothetical protein
MIFDLLIGFAIYFVSPPREIASRNHASSGFGGTIVARAPERKGKNAENEEK